MGPIDYLIETIMIPFLQFSYTTVYPNYGIAIILLTIVIKIAFFPLTKKQFESMKMTQKLQPEIKKIQEKYKDNPQQMQQAMMALWKEKGVNPFGGCLPALVQLPFFVAIFYTVGSEPFKALLAAPGVNPGLFSFWIADLTAPDGTFILPLAIGALTYATQKLMMTDSKLSAFITFMPIVMVVICVNMPGGVLLYWAVSQLISGVQQYQIVKKSTEEGVLANG